MVYGAKFQPMFERQDGRPYTILELDKLNAHEPTTLPDAHELPEHAPAFVTAKV